jgi:uncharacterized membrane protein YhaH (DUF805 family)
MQVLGLRALAACVFVFSTLVQAQGTDASGAAGCAACSGCGGLVIVIWLGLIALQIALLVWVARDAKARGMDSAILWMLLVLFFPLLGIVIYLFVRPQGNMIQCPNCGNKRLEASVKCPHCSVGS